MIHELNQADYEKVRPLFRPLAEYLLFCAAVLEDNQPGRVFVDDPTNPRTAFMITRDTWCYLAGDPKDDAFNRALNKAIFAREIVGEDVGALLLSCHPEGWQRRLATVCGPRQPIEIPRRRYICRELKYDWRANVPQGFTVQWIDESLLDRPGLEIPEDVKNLIESWGSTADPRQKGFGFVTFYDDKIVSHAVVDCIVGDAGDIGLVTAQEYRRRGLATVTSAAAVDYGLLHGLAMINWDCGEHNLGSLHTAERLGFERERDHMMYLLVFDERGHLINLAWHSLDAERYQETINVCKQMIARGDDPPPHAYFLAACAWAGLEERDKAFQSLNTAVDKGWASVHHTENRKEFETLWDTPEWTAVLKRIQQNKQKPGAGN